MRRSRRYEPPPLEAALRDVARKALNEAWEVTNWVLADSRGRVFVALRKGGSFAVEAPDDEKGRDSFVLVVRDESGRTLVALTELTTPPNALSALHQTARHIALGGDVEKTWTTDQIADALCEAMEEKAREPRTQLWRSFWDRLTEGGAIPEVHDAA